MTASAGSTGDASTQRPNGPPPGSAHFPLPLHYQGSSSPPRANLSSTASTHSEHTEDTNPGEEPSESIDNLGALFMALTRRLERKQLADEEEEGGMASDIIPNGGEGPSSSSGSAGRMTRSQTGARVGKRTPPDADYDDSPRGNRKRARAPPRTPKATMGSEEGDTSEAEPEVPTRPNTPTPTSNPAEISTATLVSVNGSIDNVNSEVRPENLSWIPKARRRGRPVPVPVPNLTKKSRGRRVPTSVSMQSVASEAGETTANEEETQATPSTVAESSTRSVLGPTSSGRIYTCQVQNCGKLFSRGEHLKRHIRSIHTYEKPFQCPVPSCGKHFSRHDNLLQHKKIHKETGELDDEPSPSQAPGSEGGSRSSKRPSSSPTSDGRREELPSTPTGSQGGAPLSRHATQPATAFTPLGPPGVPGQQLRYTYSYPLPFPMHGAPGPPPLGMPMHVIPPPFVDAQGHQYGYPAPYPYGYPYAFHPPAPGVPIPGIPPPPSAGDEAHPNTSTNGISQGVAVSSMRTTGQDDRPQVEEQGPNNTSETRSSANTDTTSTASKPVSSAGSQLPGQPSALGPNPNMAPPMMAPPVMHPAIQQILALAMAGNIQLALDPASQAQILQNPATAALIADPAAFLSALNAFIAAGAPGVNIPGQGTTPLNNGSAPAPPPAATSSQAAPNGFAVPTPANGVSQGPFSTFGTASVEAQVKDALATHAAFPATSSGLPSALQVQLAASTTTEGSVLRTGSTESALDSTQTSAGAVSKAPAEQNSTLSAMSDGVNGNHTKPIDDESLAAVNSVGS